MDQAASEGRGLLARWHGIPLYQRIVGGMLLGLIVGIVLGPRAAGLAIAPANAHPWALEVAHWTTRRCGGEGAGRDACDLLLHAQGRIEAILAHGEHP